MAVYYYLLLIIPLAYLASMSESKLAGRLVLVLTALLTIVISGFRWGSDVDHMDYARMFAETPSLENFNQDSIYEIHGEPGYLLLSSLVKSFGLDFVTLSLLCVIVSICLKIYVGSKFTSHASLAIVLYLCLHFVTIEFIQIRWAVASAIIIQAYYYQYQKRYKLSIVFLMLAFSFHYYSAIYIIVSLIVELKKDIYFNIVVLILVVLGLHLMVTDFIYLGTNQSDAYIMKRAFRYLNDPQSQLGIFSFIKLAMVPGVYYFLKSRYPAIVQDETTEFLKRIAFSSIAITVLMSFVPLMHYRAAVVSDFFSLLLFARLVEMGMDRYDRIILVTSFLVLFTVWYLIDISYYIQADRLYEYRTWINQIY